MKVIIVGAGRTGESIIKNLSSEKHDIVAIDLDAQLLEDVVDRYDVQGVCGNGCVEDILNQAGAEDADLLISVTDKDEQNILCCLVGRALGIPNLIAQVRNPNYYLQFEGMREKFGISLFVNPDATLAGEILKLLRFPSAVKVSSFARGRLEIAEVKVLPESRIAGVALKNLKSLAKADFLIVAIERNGEVIVPNGSTFIQKDDILNICAKHFEFRNVFSLFGSFKHKIQSVMIIGDDDTSYYLASKLVENGFDVKIIGKNSEKCLELKSLLPKANVACADYTDKETLDREGIGRVDALVTMSNYDENNIVASLYAKTKGIAKVITVIRKDAYKGILEEIQLDTPVSPFELTGSEIAKYVRSIDVPKGSQIISLQKIAGGKAEALHFNIGNNPAFVGKSIKDLSVDMKEGVLIVAISRKRMSVIAHGDTMLSENDDIIVTSVKNTISKLEDVLK